MFLFLSPGTGFYGKHFCRTGASGRKVSPSVNDIGTPGKKLNGAANKFIPPWQVQNQKSGI
jgi:hypothetical protein